MNMKLEKKNDEKSRLMASKNSFKDALIEKWAFKVLTFSHHKSQILVEIRFNSGQIKATFEIEIYI